MIRGKSAEESMQFIMIAIFYICLSGLLGSVLLVYTGSIKDNTAFEKSYLAKDISFVIDAMSFSPGGLEFEYNQGYLDLGKFDFTFQDGMVSVKGISSTEGLSPSKYWYHVEKTSTLYYNDLKSPYSIDFAKNGEDVFLGTRAAGRFLFECPRDIVSGDWKSDGITFDPAHLGSANDLGIISADGTRNEATLVGEVAQSLRRQRTTAVLTRESVPVPYMDRQVFSKVLIHLMAHSGPSHENKLRIYVPVDSPKRQNNRKLACMVANSLYQKVNGFTSVEIYPLSPSFLSKKDPLSVLDQGTIAIAIDLGNIDYNENHLGLSRSEISSAIWQGIDAYYT